MGNSVAGQGNELQSDRQLCKMQRNQEMAQTSYFGKGADPLRQNGLVAKPRHQTNGRPNRPHNNGFSFSDKGFLLPRRHARQKMARADEMGSSRGRRQGQK